MLEGGFAAIANLYFDVALLVSQPPHIASRLQFNCTPIGMLFGLPVNGKPVQFEEQNGLVECFFRSLKEECV